jgi:YidC/Oxa1 family membrane protein insertase
MDIKRTILWVIFVVSLFLLYDNWQREHGHASMFFPTPQSQQAANAGTDGPPKADVVAAQPTSVLPVGKAANAAANQKIHVSTDEFDADIDTLGATLSHLTLVKTGDAKGENAVTLFDSAEGHTYLARTGVVGGDFPNHTDLYTLVPGPTTLADGQNTLQVKFQSAPQGGVQVVKTYTFTRGSYVIDVSTAVTNVGSATVNPSVYVELVRDATPVPTPRFMRSFLGMAVYTNEHHFQKMTFENVEKGNEDYANKADNGWIAIIQHYFATAFVPQQGAQRQNYVDSPAQGLYRVGSKLPLPALAPGQTETSTAKLFAGPEEESLLSAVAPGLDLVKDYGWVTIVAKPLFWVLEQVHKALGNWGWSIIGVTLLIKLAFFPLSAASYRSMARMKAITPRMQALRERFKGDPQKMNQALMELYKTEKVNPFGGCLPIVIQMPVFISLYWVLSSSVEMRGAPWALWIHDLSAPDPFYILPVLMAVSMFVQTKMNPTPPDPVQARMMMVMPLAFSAMFFFFPAGLVLYYVVNNVLSMTQQYYIQRVMGNNKASGAKTA